MNNDKVAVSCTYNFAAVLKSVLHKCSYNRMLNHSGTLHNVAKRHDVEILEQATDNLSNSQENYGEG